MAKYIVRKLVAIDWPIEADNIKQANQRASARMSEFLNSGDVGNWYDYDDTEFYTDDYDQLDWHGNILDDDGEPVGRYDESLIEEDSDASLITAEMVLASAKVPTNNRNSVILCVL